MCLRKPLFSAPRKQIEATSNGGFASIELRYMKIADRRLRLYLDEHIKDILKPTEKNITSVIPDSEGITTLAVKEKSKSTTQVIIPHQAPIILQYEDEIRSASLLDLR